MTPREGEPRLLGAAQQPGREAVAPLDLAEERLAVLRVADGAGRERERPLGAERLGLTPVVGETVPNPCDRQWEQPPPGVDTLAEPRDREPAGDLARLASTTSATSSRVEFVPRSTAATRIEATLASRESWAMVRRRYGLTQIVIAVGAIQAYEAVRRLLHPDWTAAMANARQVETRSDGPRWGWRWLQGAFLDMPCLVQAVNIFYFVGHFLAHRRSSSLALPPLA